MLTNQQRWNLIQIGNDYPEMLYIVMGKTSERVYEHFQIPLTRPVAEWHAETLNQRYRYYGLPVEFYITPILDI